MSRKGKEKNLLVGEENKMKAYMKTGEGCTGSNEEGLYREKQATK